MSNQQTVKELKDNYNKTLLKRYCSYRLKDENNQKELESKVLALLEGPLRNRDEYQKEKCIKSFCEGLVYLEQVLLFQRNIDSYAFNFNNHHLARLYEEKMNDVRRIMTREINRQFIHFITFL